MLTIGNTIVLKPFTNNNNNENVEYRTKIVDIYEDTFFIELPVNKKTEKTEIFNNGTRFTSLITIKNNAIYEFPTKLISRKTENIPMLELSIPMKEKFVRIQRRSHVRVDFITHIEMQLIRTDNPLFPTIMFNISGGGMAAILPKKYQVNVNDLIMCRFLLPCKSGDVFFNELCKIVRIVYDKENKQNKVFMLFQNIKERERQKIIQFCFQKQLEVRRKTVN